MKLKTLKDIDRYCIHWINIHSLKQEAIKWVKEYDGLIEEVTINWIKHFFNITEEDLK